MCPSNLKKKTVPSTAYYLGFEWNGRHASFYPLPLLFMRTYPSFFSQGGLEGVTWVCSYPVWKLYMHDLLFHPVLNSWDGEDDCFEFCLCGNFAMPWGGSERDLKSKQTLDNWRNCNSTLFNARPKTSWKSCQSSWRNWRSRPSTRQVGRLQIVNSKLTIDQKSWDKMNIVHNM